MPELWRLEHAAQWRATNNQPVTKGLASLRYADDDGDRYYELLSLLGWAHILSVLDESSQTRQ